MKMTIRASFSMHHSSFFRTLAISILLCAAAAERLGAQQNTTDRQISQYQSRASIFAKDYSNYDKLGAAYIQKGRETGDVTYYDLAEKALSRSLELVSNDMWATAPTTHLAVVYMAEHRFHDALAEAQNALALGSGDPSPWAIAGDALTDMGEYDKASEAYSKLEIPGEREERRSGLAYARDSRMSYLKFILGDPLAAVQLMRGAIQSAIETHALGENIAWSQFQLGEYFFQMADLTNAETAYQDALAAYPGYYRALAGLGKVRAAQSRHLEAIDWYEKSISVVPFPDYVAALGDVYAKMGRSAEAKKRYDLVEFIAHLSALNKQVYNRELAIFYADRGMNLKASLDLAQKELEVRQDIYTWDALAWALYKNGKFQEATDAMAKALRLGTKDAMLFFHAGMIYDRVGNAERAKEYLQRALTTNPHFHVFYVDIAKNSLREFGEQKAVSRRQ